MALPACEIKSHSPHPFADVDTVLEWLRVLGLSRYEEAFVKEEVDWETLQWLTEEVYYNSLISDVNLTIDLTNDLAAPIALVLVLL